MKITEKLKIRNLLLLITMCSYHIVLAQNSYISPDIKPYVDFIENCNTSPVDYIMGLFEKYDVVVLGERDHRDTTQYILIQQIISDPRFIDKVGNVLTEVGIYNMRDELNKVLQTNYKKNYDFDKALAEVHFNIQWIPFWEKTNYVQFHRDIYNINKKLPANKKINVYPTDVQYSWKLNDNHPIEQLKSFYELLSYRDLIMGNNAADALYKIFSSSRKKALIIYNTPHSCKYYKSTDWKFFAYQVIADRFPGKVANVALNWAAANGYNEPYTGLSNDGKWDAAFAACDNKSIGFDLSGTIFGDDNFDFMFHVDYDEPHTFKDVYHGFIFYKPASEWIISRGIPIFCNLDNEYVKDEIARRFLITRGGADEIINAEELKNAATEELKEQLYEYLINLNVSKIFEGESLEMINKQIERYYKPK
jgi:hypothetical protein